jgi:hypothetical protein
MLERILTDEFRNQLKATFMDIRETQEKKDEDELAKDEERLRREIIDSIEPYRSDVVFEADYRVSAVDGSGSSELATFNDVRVHLLSTSTIVLDTNTKNGAPFVPMDRTELEAAVGRAQPYINSYWHSGVRGDARGKMAETLEDIYPVNDVSELILPFFRDTTNGQIRSIADLSKSRYSEHVAMLQTMESLIFYGQFLTNSHVHDELRKASEYAAARAVITSEIGPRYLLLDGAMSMFLHQVGQYPIMPTGFMLRELCSIARDKGVVLCAVSKSHTVPGADRIAALAEEVVGKGTKWFCVLPGQNDPGGGLHILQKRTYIPPHLAVPYLFSFSQDNRPSRIDFDRVWWFQNIFVPSDPRKTRQNEKALFRDIEFMSRDARWYGYPVALALAHEECKLSYEDLRLAKEIADDVSQELGMGSRRAEPFREDYNL